MIKTFIFFSDELDSYMYQTVGHNCIDLYSEAMGVPLFRRTIEGSSVAQGRDYTETSDDEVEDLYQLIKEVKVGGHYEQSSKQRLSPCLSHVLRGVISKTRAGSL